MSGGIGLLTAVLLIGAAAPPEPSCEPVMGPGLKAGSWGVVQVKLINTWRAKGRTVLMQRGERSLQAVTASPVLRPDQQGEYFLPFRPLDAGMPLQLGVGDKALKAGVDWSASSFPNLVLPEGEPLILEVRASAGSELRLPVPMQQGRIHPDRLPEWPAAYEGVDVLVLSELASQGISASRRKALHDWFRAGGTVVVTSESALLKLSDVLLDRRGAGLPSSEAGWRELLGESAGESIWKNGRPLLAGFRTGFGRGLLVLPDGDGSRPEWVAAAQEAYRARPASIAPLIRRGLYNREGEDFPRLEEALVGAGRALRRALFVLLVLVAAGAALWRRGRRARLAVALAVLALVCAVGLGTLFGSPRMRGLSVRIDEYSSDGAGARSRQYLYLEKVGASAGANIDVLCAPGVLPSAVLYAGGEASDISYRLEARAESDDAGFRLADFSFGEASIFLGAGPLPGAELLRAPPPGSRPVRIDDLSKRRAIAEIADCLSDARGRCRAQAEFLAATIWEERHLQDALSSLEGKGEGKVTVTVCRLPADEAALRPESDAVTVMALHRLGIFYGAEK
jgi:hypothetical protein